jgi:hypothetical protein
LLVDALAARAASLFSCSLAYTLACTPHAGAVLCARSRTPFTFSTERLTDYVPFPHTHPISLRTFFDVHRRILQGAETRTEGAILSAMLFSLARTHCLALFACCVSHNSQPSPNRHTIPHRHSPPTPRSGLQVYTLCPADTSLRLPTFASIVPRLCRFSDVCGRCATPQPQSKTSSANAVSCPVDGCVSVRGATVSVARFSLPWPRQALPTDECILAMCSQRLVVTCVLAATFTIVNSSVLQTPLSLAQPLTR